MVRKLRSTEEEASKMGWGWGHLEETSLTVRHGRGIGRGAHSHRAKHRWVRVRRIGESTGGRKFPELKVQGSKRKETKAKFIWMEGDHIILCYKVPVKSIGDGWSVGLSG